MSARPVAAGDALYSVADTREFDAEAIRAGTPGIDLMERAGVAAFRLLRARWPGVRSVGVLAGSGNNGGDGYIVARLARDAGLDVCLRRLGNADRMGDDARVARERFAGSDDAAIEDVQRADVLVDALFGIGLRDVPRGEAAACIERLASREGCGVLALDVPSGLNADTGAAPGAVLPAELCITFIVAKRGLVTGGARDVVGELWLADLGVEPLIPPEAELCDFASLRRHLPPRARAAHKGLFGHVLVIGGDEGYGGAVRLAAEAAARTGAGLVSVGTRGEHVAPLLAARPEIMTRAIDAPGALDALLARVGRGAVLAAGPGLGTGEFGAGALIRLVATDQPLVLDADALNLVAGGQVRLPAGRDAPLVLTPHPGEAARLLGTDIATVEADRYHAVATLAEKYDAVVLLKGAGTLVEARRESSPFVAVIGGGNPGMATGGMGDVLTGVVAAMLAQMPSATEAGDFHATCVAAAAHAAAGDMAARAGERSLLATDVVEQLRAVLG